MKRSALNRFAIFVSLSTLFLIVAGAMVTSTGSGLAVPDWPLSFGKFFPPMEGGVFFEHGHRMVAGIVGILTAVLAGWVVAKETRGWLKGVALAALGAVIVQAILGGLTVLYGLPPAISISHAVLAQTFFCLTVALALFTSPEWNLARMERISGGTGALFRLSALTTALIYAQLILGATLRHGGSLSFLYSHIVGAVVVSAAVIALGVFALRNFRGVASLRVPASLLLGGLALQLLLGLSAYLPLIGVFPFLMLGRIQIVTAHVATGAFLLAVSFLLTLWSWRWRATSGGKQRPDFAVPGGLPLHE